MNKQKIPIKSGQTKKEFSSGGVVYKKDKNSVKWLVSKHSGYHKWGFPKGLIEDGESLEKTAMREVEEECGIKAKIIKKIVEPEKYIYMIDVVKVFKQVDYFLMEYVSGNIEDHDWEMEKVEWLNFDEAIKRLDFDGAKKLLKKARDLRL